MNEKAKLRGCAGLAVIAVAITCDPAMAQAVEDEATSGDIIVTARKRDETSIAVPVALTAIGAAELERRAISNLDTLARSVPQLMIGEGGGTIQGGNISLRGLGSPDTNPFADQAVSFNIDGVQVARASVRRLSDVDIAQVEVLKGPQALFFGKNSPAGIISIRTADPTSSLSGRISAGYEFVAHELRGDGFISGPITDTLGVRLALYGSRMRGWSESVIPAASPLQADHRWAPRKREYGGRVTLKWEPSDRFNVRIKLNYGKARGDDANVNSQLTDCPLGAPQSGAVDDCKADDKHTNSNIGPVFGTVDPIFGNGSTISRQSNALHSIELNYDVTEFLRITSITGLYKTRFWNRSNFTSYIPAGPVPLLASVNRFRVREISEELRLTSGFEGPFNFMVGGHYQDSHAETGSTTYRNAITPLYNNNFYLIQDGKAWSIFGQLMWKVVPELELAAGGRYSKERKKLPGVFQGSVAAPALVRRTTADDEGSWNNFSPEFTVAYRPSNDLTVFGSYKRGFLSGGFNSGAGNVQNDLTYDQQTIRGFEAGVKANLLDRRLRANLTVYSYKTRGLQVTVGVVDPATNITFQTIRNAGSVSTKGAELDLNYRTPVPGLALRGAVSYNRGRYDRYIALCYRGQTQALGCNLNLTSAGIGTSQDLSGTELVRAPRWSGNLGAIYETAIGRGLKLGLSGDMSFSDSYFADASSKPAGRQDSYQLFDASIELSDEDDRWAVALIGRNLSDKYYITRAIDATFTGTPAGGLTGTLADTAAVVSRGREIMLRLTHKFGR